MRDVMKTNEEIQREAQRMLDLGRQYREQHRGASGEVVPLPRVLVQLPDVQVSRPAVPGSDAESRIVTRQRHIEAAIADDGMIYRLMERETELGAVSGAQAEVSEVMVSRAGFDLLHAGYEMVEEDRLFELLTPYSERAENRSDGERIDDREVAEVETILETHLLPASDRMRTKAEIVEYLEGRLEPGVFIAHAIDRLCAREGQQQVQTQRHALRLTINEP
jgi:hypothetical protein